LLIVNTSKLARGDLCAPLCFPKTVGQLKSKEKHMIAAYQMTASMIKVFTFV